jgi:Domain of unknown function (DUF4412)
MKKLIIVLLAVISWSARAQGFEGTIVWSMNMEITDPVTKAKMEDAKKKMNDPANQAKMKEMQAKMNDPQMKAMMDANPQMKAQMEMALKAMSGGDMTSMIPKGFTIRIKGSNSLSKTDGGMMEFETLYLSDKSTAYRIDRKNKTYSPMGAGREPVANDNKPKVTKTNETAKILDYTCTKYLVESNEHGKTYSQTIWATTEIKDIDLKSMAKQSAGRGQSLYHEGIDGVPLKIEAATNEGKMVMEVTAIKRESLSAADFTLPADFKEVASGFGR